MIRLLLIILCVLVSLTDLKVADIQPGGLFLLFAIPLGVAIALHRQWSLRVPRRLCRLAGQYLLFVMCTAILAALAWRFHFYVPAHVSWLKFPPIISFVRIVQVVMAVVMMIVVATIVQRYQGAGECLAHAYVVVGLITVFYGTACWLLIWHSGAAATHIRVSVLGARAEWGVIRERGAFVEGGPFGVYVASVLAVSVFRRFVQGKGTRAGFAATVGVLLTGLMLSHSKAGLCAVLAVGIWSFFVSRRVSLGRKLYAVVISAALIVPVLLIVNLSGGMRSYWFAYDHAELLAMEAPFNGSTVEGRVVALYVVPAMVEKHPLAGIGIGNYSVLRNSPEYSPGFPPAPGWDEPGLGFFGYAAELGLPLLAWLMFLVWTPVRIAREMGERDTPILVACAFQFFADLFGTPITFYYPYLVSALALGYVLRARTSCNSRGTSPEIWPDYDKAC